MVGDKLDAIVSKLDAVHEDVIALKTQMTSVIGNGQPGRLGNLEKQVEELKGQVNRWRGAVAILAFLLVLVGGADVWHVLAK